MAEPTQLTLSLSIGRPVRGANALVTRDDGNTVLPTADADWDDWVSAGAIRNWARNDGMLDWLDRYGGERGIARDDQRAAYDEHFDFQRFLARQGRRFEEKVLEDLERRVGLTRIDIDRDDARSLATAHATVAAIERGERVIAQGLLRDPQTRTYGRIDLLVRSDVLATLCGDAFGENDDPSVPAPALHGAAWHYRVIDIKFSTLDLLKDGSLSTSSDLSTSAQVWTYNQMLARVQGHVAPFAYVLGRAWRQGNSGRGDTCWEKVARIPAETYVRSREAALADVVADGRAWIRRVRREGAAWNVLPVPTIPELWPNMKNDSDHPWHEAKRELAEDLRELTLLWRVSAAMRDRARGRGVTRWDDPRISADWLGITGETYPAMFDALIAVNRETGPALRPAHIDADDGRWRVRAPLELYVDFETVNDLNDDFATFPRKGGQSLIFQVGCGTYADGAWEFAQFTARSLTPAAEAEMIDAWLAHLAALARRTGLGGAADARLFHWSAAETVFMEGAYNSARARHPERGWPLLGWYDLLERIVHAAPVVVRGARSFGLKAVARAMKSHGLIETEWGEGLADGTGAMAGAWAAADLAAKDGGEIGAVELMREVSRYNEIDCRVMAEVLDDLRRNH
ncbi:MAG TPA: hypothetical protein DCK98_17260 [Chloroflexi bacterium]|jgi:hypothetical protein|nr:hypothetical protein [Chloroflexota bacterium]HAL26786.1 hypothetical protein [Chloroflexota bacterium]